MYVICVWRIPKDIILIGSYQAVCAAVDTFIHMISISIHSIHYYCLLKPSTTLILHSNKINSFILFKSTQESTVSILGILWYDKLIGDFVSYKYFYSIVFIYNVIEFILCRFFMKPLSVPYTSCHPLYLHQSLDTLAVLVDHKPSLVFILYMHNLFKIIYYLWTNRWMNGTIERINECLSDECFSKQVYLLSLLNIETFGKRVFIGFCMFNECSI